MRFGDKAHLYERHALQQKKTAAWLAEWLEEDGRGLHACELGAGTGLFTRHLAAKGFESLVASDSSERMMDMGKLMLPQVEWHIADAWNYSQPMVDRLYTCSLLQWCPDPLSTLRSWRKSLKPNGKLLAAFFIKGTLQELNDLHPRFAAVEWRDTQEWISLFVEAGWSVKRSGARRDTIEYDSTLEALSSLHNTGAVQENRMTAVELRKLQREGDELWAEEDKIPLSWMALRVECESA